MTDIADFALDSSDCAKIAEVMETIAELSGRSNIRIDRVDFVIYNEHRITATRRGKWSPLALRKIRKVLR